MQYHRTIDRTFAVADHPELHIANRSGELSVIGEDREDIVFAAQLTVHADGESEGRRRLDAIDLPIREANGRVDIGPPSADEQSTGRLTLFGVRLGIDFGGARVDMVARVPRGCAVTARQRSGPLRIGGIHGRVDAEIRSGRTELHDIQGPVSLTSTSGGVEIAHVCGDLSVESRSGRVQVNDVEGGVRLSSRSGSVTARDVSGPLEIHGRSGRVRLEDVAGPLTLRTRSGGVEWRGRVAHPLDIEVHSGGVRLAVTRDSAFYMDAEARAGSVRSELPVDFLERPPEGAPTVRVRTHAGSIRVVAA